jgi:hypothetical protein
MGEVSAYCGSLAAKPRLSRSGTLSIHTRSIQLRLRAAQSSPPRPLFFCIADIPGRDSSKALPRRTRPFARDLRCFRPTEVCQLVASVDVIAITKWAIRASEKRPFGMLPDILLRRRILSVALAQACVCYVSRTSASYRNRQFGHYHPIRRSVPLAT